MSKNVRCFALIGLCLAVVLTAAALSQAQNPRRPPEYNELAAASQIKDAAARLKEFERIKAAYPATRFMGAIDRYIFNTKVELAEGLDAILALQKDFLAAGKGPARLQAPLIAADQILTHPKLKTFDKAVVLAAVLSYRDLALKVSAEPDAYEGVPANQRDRAKYYAVTSFGILVAQAYLNAGDAALALAALEAFKKEGGLSDDAYSYTLGETYGKLGRTKEAYEACLAAAVAGHEQALASAREFYIKLNGKADGFEAALEAKARELPYAPGPFKAPAGWTGRTVLAELFTGSECPPCVAADLGFDGLVDTYPPNYLAVLVYHLPIPRPDPMINAASKKRQDYYGVNSTPTVFIDGEKDATGGGPRGLAEAKFTQYRTAVDGRLGSAPEAALKLKATRTGDALKVEFDPGPAVAGADYQVVLVQGEERYKGSNGLEYHKMVVRDIVTVDPAVGKTTSFDLAASERTADQYLTDFETTNTRFQGFKFAERHHKIDRGRLRVVFFAQDRATKKVLNAAVAEVK
jgi:hypothetical protein